MVSWRIAAVIATALACFNAGAVTRFVDAFSGSDTSDCQSSAAPCKTITYAMTQATAGGSIDPGDRISVASGLYNMALGETFPIVVKAGVWLSSYGLPSQTVIDATGSNQRVLTAISCCGTRIWGFTIRGGLHAPPADGSVAQGGGLLVAASANVQQNIFVDNEARGYDGTEAFPDGGSAQGGAVAAIGSSSYLRSNLFIANTARGGKGKDQSNANPAGKGGNALAGGLYAMGHGLFEFNTFHDNAALGGAGGASTANGGDGGKGAGGSIALGTSDSMTLTGNMLTAGIASGGMGGTGSSPGTMGIGAAGGLLDATGSGQLTCSPVQNPCINITYTLFHDNIVSGATGPSDAVGTGAVFGDPLLHRPPNLLRIRNASPAAAKVPNSGLAVPGDFDGRLRNPRSIGAYEPSTFTGDRTDLDRDRMSDVLWRNDQTGQVWFSYMAGLAVRGGALPYVEPNTAWTIVADGDFNGDGYTDLLWRNSTTGQVFMMLMGAGGVPSDGAFIAQADAAWKAVHVRDVDCDGKADILWWNSATGDVWLMVMNGFAIRWQGSIYREPDTSWRIAAVGDLNFYGCDTQVIWHSRSTGGVAVVRIYSSNGWFYATNANFIYQEPNTDWKIVGVADLNGDGYGDLVWRNASTGMVYGMLLHGEILNDPGGAVFKNQGVIHQEPNTAWKVVALGDYNGDGKTDILWRNDSTGQVYLMLMDGLFIASQGFIYQEPNTSWKILGPWEYGQASGSLQ